MSRHQTPQQREQIMDNWLYEHFDRLGFNGWYHTGVLRNKPKELSERIFKQLLRKYCLQTGNLGLSFRIRPQYRKNYYDRWRREQNEVDKYKFVER